MAFTNNVMIVRHGLLAKLVKLWKGLYDIHPRYDTAP